MGKNNGYLSVIIPVYNAESTIERCLESVLNQTYNDFEVILIDDGSTDKSYVLCERYAKKEKRITAVHIENSGPYQARKAGAEIAKGDILTFSDADDWFEKNAFETAADIFSKYNPDILAYTYLCDGDKVERHLYEEKLYCGAEIQEEIIPGMMYDSAFGGRRLNPSLCCKWIKKELYIKVTESVKDRITLGEDALVTYPAVCAADSILICNKALYHYDVNAYSCTRTYPLERILEVKAFQDNMMFLFAEMELLEQTRYQIDNYVRSFVEMMIKKWYGIELSPMSFCIPDRDALKGAKILVYGAGGVGKSYINELKLTGCASIAGWVDQNYRRLCSYNQVNIIAPEHIRELAFDIVLIAVWDDKSANDIKYGLLAMGIPESKIFWKKPIHI